MDPSIYREAARRVLQTVVVPTLLEQTLDQLMQALGLATPPPLPLLQPPLLLQPQPLPQPLPLPPSTAGEINGGVYCVRITDISVVHQAAALVLLKFGRTNDYRTRFAQFKFAYEVLFQVDGKNTMEEWLHKKLQPNVKRTFWLPKTKVKSMKKDLCFPDSSNPGPTEWVVVSKALYERLCAARLTPENYEQILGDIFQAQKPVLAPAEAIKLLRVKDGRSYAVSAKASMLYY